MRAEVAVGMSSCGIAAGARVVLETLKADIAARSLPWVVVSTGCNGACHREPLVEIRQPDGKTFLYGNVDAAGARRIAEGHLAAGVPVAELLVPPDYPYLARQKRIVLANCGTIDPESIDEYLARDGYAALRKVLSSMTSDQVIAEITASGLRGRGGAGFSTGMKWTFARRAKGAKKYVICNADEGDPGAFMDRSAIEGDPHTVVEGMIIGGYAVGAQTGIVYIRAEYPLAIKRIRRAIEDARSHGLLGKNILGSNFSFDIEIRLGAGAFVCGEETALIHSIEGARGMPRPRPPYPAAVGLFSQPTLINNVETWANIPVILLDGANWFRTVGTETSKGTKVFALAGKVVNTGLIEVPMGTTLREIIYDVGGGIPFGKRFKSVQTGGPSGGCLPEQYLDTPIDYESLARAGSIMGSGGMIVIDEDSCMVDVARFFLEFTQDESCGKCTPCREGTKRMLEILTRITEGKGRPGDIENLERLGGMIKKSALCGLGQSAPNPVLSTIKNFREEYEEHIHQKRCRAKACKSLVNYEITDKCVGCGACRRACPVSAISGSPKSRHVLDQNKCIRCGMCFTTCKFEAIAKV